MPATVSVFVGGIFPAWIHVLYVTFRTQLPDCPMSNLAVNIPCTNCKFRSVYVEMCQNELAYVPPFTALRKSIRMLAVQFVCDFDIE